MLVFLTRRLLQIIPTLILVSMLIFGLQQLLPGDPALIMAGEERDPIVLQQIREQYRAVLSDLSDGAIDLETGRLKRDDLMNRLHGIYENAPPAEYPAYQAAARAVLTSGDPALTDEEIDRFLPKSLQKAEKPA